MIKILLNTFIILAFCAGFTAQEFVCNVSVVAPTLKSDPANKEIFSELENTVKEFVEATKWTNDVYADQEKIDLSILITINTKQGSDNFTGTIQISSVRPVYNSLYLSRLFNFLDENFVFEYQRGAALIFTPDRHQSNLADVIAYYCFMVLGYDYDSFSMKGGTKYFIKAQQIVSNCQNASEPGWKPTDGRKNRYTLVDNALNNAFENLRKCYYDYHRNGFDILYSKRSEAVNNIFLALKSLEVIHKTQPNSINVQLFFAAKVDEIISLFLESPQNIRNKVYITVSRLDPGNISKYNKLKTGS